MPFTQRAHDATASSIPGEPTPQETLFRRYHQVRQFTERLCQPLVTEDYVIQAMPDVSPPKWHLAHTSWFFETFVLTSASPSYRSPHTSYAYLFNSYYVAAGERHAAQNGDYSRVQLLRRSIAIAPLWTSRWRPFRRIGWQRSRSPGHLLSSSGCSMNNSIKNCS